MNRLVVCLAGVATLLVACVSLAEGGEISEAEKTKIVKLIEHVKELKDAVFVRNGVEYDAATAAKFLQGKWDANAAEIKSAGEFIDKAASVSSTTGKPYLIRLRRSTTTQEFKSGEYLHEQLKKLELPRGDMPKS